MAHKKYRSRLILSVTIIGTLFLVSSFVVWQARKHTIYIIGDSTVKNGDGTGKQELWGWGSFLADRFDTTRISVQNHAIGGRSSRTFLTDGRWDRILATLQRGDYVIMQFGHNDSGPLDDTARARGTIRGIGEDSTTVYNPIRKVNEVVHTYGWYLRKYIQEARSKGAISIVCSPVPRNIFKEGKVERANKDYGEWASAVAKANGAFFIPLNDLIADEYEKLGADSVKHFFPGDHTHPNKNGSQLNADMVVKGIWGLRNNDLKEYLKK